MVENLIANKKIAYYHGCFSNYYYPQVGEATVKVLNKNGIEIVVPDQVCCALPMMSKGNYKDAYKNMEFNIKNLSTLVDKGYAVVVTCSSCGLFLKQDCLHLVNTTDSKKVSDNLYHITEYLLKLDDIGLLNKDFRALNRTVFYHTPCHLRVQKLDQPTVKLLELIPGIKVIKISEECCGMGGAYGYEKVNFELSKDIAQKLGAELKEYPSDRIVTDCGGCRLQIEAISGGRGVDHPIILVKEAYGL